MQDRPTILFVDDEPYYLRELVRSVRASGFIVTFVSSVKEAKEFIADRPPDLAILDVAMPTGDDDSEFETKGGFTTGMLLAEWIASNYPKVLFCGLSAHDSAENAEYFTRYGAGYLRKPISGHELERWIHRALAGDSRGQHVKSFIIHGHNDQAKLDLKNYLQNTLKLLEPVILHEQPSLGRTIIEKFEDAASDVDIVFVLLTPDDHVGEARTSNAEKRRARQNVIFEMGYFLAKLTRRSGKVLLLHEGPIELPSDISGLVYIDISGGVPSAGEAIRRELQGIL